jgi:hypothetical protein
MSVTADDPFGLKQKFAELGIDPGQGQGPGGQETPLSKFLSLDKQLKQPNGPMNGVYEPPVATLPHSEDAEKALLCSLVLDPVQTEDEARAQLTAESFYIPANQIIYSLLLEFRDKNRPIDFVTVKEALIGRKQLAEIGGVEYLDHVWTFVPSAANANCYATTIRENQLRREAVLGARQIIGLAQDPGFGFDSVRDEIEKILTTLSGQAAAKEKSLREITLDWHADLCSRAERLEQDGFRFGIPSVDEALGAIRPGDYVVIGAETGGGKSMLAFQGGLHAAAHWSPCGGIQSRDEQRATLGPDVCAHLPGFHEFIPLGAL